MSNEGQTIIEHINDVLGDYEEHGGVGWGEQVYRIALASLTQPAAPPQEPTPEMQVAGAAAIRFDTTPINKMFTANAVWRAMLAAAPEAQC